MWPQMSYHPHPFAFPPQSHCNEEGGRLYPLWGEETKVGSGSRGLTEKASESKPPSVCVLVGESISGSKDS